MKIDAQGPRGLPERRAAQGERQCQKQQNAAGDDGQGDRPVVKFLVFMPVQRDGITRLALLYAPAAFASRRKPEGACTCRSLHNVVNGHRMNSPVDESSRACRFPWRSAADAGWMRFCALAGSSAAPFVGPSLSRWIGRPSKPGCSWSWGTFGPIWPGRLFLKDCGSREKCGRIPNRGGRRANRSGAS